MISQNSFTENGFLHNGQNYRIGHGAHHGHYEHQHSAPTASNRNGSGRSQKSSAGSTTSNYAGNEDSPRTSASELHKVKSESVLSKTTNIHAPLIGSSYEIAALRKHVKVLEDRLRAERHTHAVKFSEVEKQLIQENAKLKVSSSALQRQIKREQQMNADNEAELTKLRKERKSRFSLSGITRSFSDVRLEDMEMKESSLKRRETDSEVVQMIKERLQDSEKDRLEAEGVFNQRISTLLRERNIQRTEMQNAEEIVAKLTSENEALQKATEELRSYIANIGENVRTQTESVQTANLRRSNQQLQEQLDHLSREKDKLLAELEDISEELTLVRANEQQNKDQHRLILEMKGKVDSLRNNMVPTERKSTFSTDAGVTSRSVQDYNGTFHKKEVETTLEITRQELKDTRGKLISILELSQRYELHCYNLEKELSKVYGKNYQYVDTGWRKKDKSFIEKLTQVVNKGKTGRSNSSFVDVHIPSSAHTNKKIDVISTQSQTDPVPSADPQPHPTKSSVIRNPQIEELFRKVKSIIELIAKVSPNSSPVDTRRRAIQGKAIANAFDELLSSIRAGQSHVFSVDVTKTSEASLEVQSLQRSIRALETKNNLLEAKFRRLQIPVENINDDDQLDDNDTPITQAEVEEKIRQVRIQLTQAKQSNASLAANTLLDCSAKTSGIWTSYSESNSSHSEEVDSQARPSYVLAS